MKRIIRYLLFTFALTYLAHGTLAMATAEGWFGFQSPIGQTLFILGGSSPTIFAFIFVFGRGGDAEKRSFKKRLLSYRHPVGSWLFALGVPVVLGGIFQLSHVLLGDHVFDSPMPMYLFFVMIFSSVLFGGIEEIGWRGFVQERLMGRGNLVIVAVTIGIIWGLWHVPLFFIADVSHASYDFLPFLLGAVMFSTYLSWLYAKTGSILLVVLFHASINAAATIGLGFFFRHDVLTYVVILLLCAIGCGLLVMHGRNTESTQG